jgi:hypothetical protein
MRRIVSLYPADWRSRYEDEFEALLASRPPTIGDRIDIVRGAVDARLHPQVGGPRRVADRFWYIPLVGLAAFALALFVMMNGPIQRDSYGEYRDGMAAVPLFVLSFVLLSVGLLRIVDRLPMEATGSRTAGSVAIVIGPLWAFMPWVFLIVVLFLVCVLCLAVGARRAGIMPTWGVVALVAALAIPAMLFVASLFLPWYALRSTDLEPLVLVAPFCMLWIVIGATLRRGFPEAAREAPAR